VKPLLFLSFFFCVCPNAFVRPKLEKMRKLTVKTGELEVFKERQKKKDKRKDRGRGSWKTIYATETI
jgi:hypothetical protein